MPSHIVQTLQNKLQNRSAKIAVLGLGYVGLPLVTVFGQAGFSIIGIDPDKKKIDLLNKGESYIPDVATADIADLKSNRKLYATTDFSELRNVDAVAICVPTPLNKTGEPDMSYILSASSELAKYIHPEMVIVLESTTYPGTTREVLQQKLEENPDIKVGENLFLAFSPERVDPGREDWTTKNTPKVIGGITQTCTEVATCWYSQALDTVVPVSSTEVAEMSKLLENTFRMINIGLVNELTIMCERLGIDVWEVIDAAATKPFGFMKFTPGPGLGGHCIPIDPLYLSWKMRAFQYNAHFIELASEINTNMPRYVVSRILKAMNDRKKLLNGSTCFVLGVAYKPDIDDLRESPALDVIDLLQEHGAEVKYHDPYIPSLTTNKGLIMESENDLLLAVKESDCVVIITNHSCYEYDNILDHAKFIFDARNALGATGKYNGKVVRL